MPFCFDAFFIDKSLYLRLLIYKEQEQRKNLKIKTEISLFIIYHCFSDNTFQAINDSLIYMNLNNNLNRGFVYKMILIISLLNMFIRY